MKNHLSSTVLTLVMLTLSLALMTHRDVPLAAAMARTMNQQTPTVPPNWQRIDTGFKFSVAVPANWTYRPLVGFDSDIGEFVGDGVTLEFDHGHASSSLPAPGTPGYEVFFETIDGRAAKLVIAREAPADITGVYFARLTGSRVAWMLEIHGRGLTPPQQDLAVRIFRSITFSTPFATVTYDTPSPTSTFIRIVVPSDTPRPTKTPTRLPIDQRRIYLPYAYSGVSTW